MKILHLQRKELVDLEAPVNEKLVERVCNILDDDAKYQTLEFVIERLCNIIDDRENQIEQLSMQIEQMGDYYTSQMINISNRGR